MHIGTAILVDCLHILTSGSSGILNHTNYRNYRRQNIKSTFNLKYLFWIAIKVRSASW